MDQSQIEIVIFSLQSNEDIRQRLYQYLTVEEKQRAARYHFEIHRNKFIVCRGILRRIIAYKSGCDTNSIRFVLNPHGKPSIAVPDCLCDLQFNISNSGDIGGVALSEKTSLGFDLEYMNTESDIGDLDSIVENQFSLHEYDWYIAHAKEDRVRSFYALWTCKEAYLKALGIGLRGGLDRFTIDLHEEKPAVVFSELENGKQSIYSLNQLTINDEYISCLAHAQDNPQIIISHWDSSRLFH